MQAAIDATSNAFKQTLNDQLEGIFLFGSVAQELNRPGDSDVDMLVVVADDTSPHLLRAAFQPVWQEYSDDLKHAPLIATRTAFTRHMKLNPALARHISRCNKQLFGPQNLLTFNPKEADSHELIGYVVAEALQASMALTPQLLDEETAAVKNQQLRTLYRHVFHNNPHEQDTAVQIFAQIQQFLNQIVPKLPAAKKWAAAKGKGTTSPLLPGLQSIYKEMGTTILVSSFLIPDQIVRIEWDKLGKHLPSGTTGLQITTVEQFCLLCTYERPVDVLLRKFQHNWGIDFLPKLAPTNRQFMRQGSRLPADILVEALPNTYLTKENDDDETLHKIIHDYQNKMLNIRLENELMSRFGKTEKFTPPEPVPDRETPPRERIDALFNQFKWWSEFYADAM